MPGVTAPPVLRVRHDGERVGGLRPQRILLVEDDEFVRSLLVLALQLGGYEVHAASDAATALELADALPSLDLVVADVGLPRLSGPDLVRRLQQERPGLRALHITGHFDREAARFGLDPDEPLLRKPFTPGELVAAVGSLVAA